MKKLKEKLKDRGGFTLVEMLIVVAIIAILIAVSIPMFSNTLEKTRHGVDAANLRDAISLANAEYLSDLNPSKNFASALKYTYEIDSTTHQAELVKGGSNGVVPQCTCGEAKGKQLVVSIQHVTGGSKPTIIANWIIGDDGKVNNNPAFS